MNCPVTGFDCITCEGACRILRKPQIIGVDRADGRETHVEGYWQNGVLTITKVRETLHN